MELSRTAGANRPVIRCRACLPITTLGILHLAHAYSVGILNLRIPTVDLPTVNNPTVNNPTVNIPTVNIPTVKHSQVMAAMMNPKVMAAMAEVQQNPAAAAKFQSDPELMQVFEMLQDAM